MKKQIILGLMALTLTLSACGNDAAGVEEQAENVQESVVESAEEVVASEEEEDAETEEAETEDADQEEIGTEEESEEEDTDQGEFSRGVVQDNTYESVFLKVGCALGDEWAIADDTELLQLSGVVYDTLDESEFFETLDTSGLIYDFYAATEDQSLNIVIQDLNSAGSSMDLNEETYVDLAKGQMKEALSSIGYEDVSLEQSTITIAGKEHASLAISATVQSIPLYEKQVYIKVGEYMGVITAASYNEDRTDELLALFYEIQ